MCGGTAFGFWPLAFGLGRTVWIGLSTVLSIPTVTKSPPKQKTLGRAPSRIVKMDQPSHFLLFDFVVFLLGMFFITQRRNSPRESFSCPAGATIS